MPCRFNFKERCSKNAKNVGSIRGSSNEQSTKYFRFLALVGFWTNFASIEWSRVKWRKSHNWKMYVRWSNTGNHHRLYCYRLFRTPRTLRRNSSEYTQRFAGYSSVYKCLPIVIRYCIVMAHGNDLEYPPTFRGWLFPVVECIQSMAGLSLPLHG